MFKFLETQRIKNLKSIIDSLTDTLQESNKDITSLKSDIEYRETQREESLSKMRCQQALNNRLEETSCRKDATISQKIEKIKELTDTLSEVIEKNANLVLQLAKK